MVWLQFGTLQRLVRGAHAAVKCFSAITVLTFFAVVTNASAQSNQLPSIFLSPDKPFFQYWVKICSADNDFSTRRRCFTAKDSYKRGELVANVGILEADGGLRKFFVCGCLMALCFSTVCD